MHYAVARGIFDLKELDCVKQEEAEAAAHQVPTSAPNLPVFVPSSSIDAVDWSAYNFNLLLL
jgi:hypothetical protein